METLAKLKPAFKKDGSGHRRQCLGHQRRRGVLRAGRRRRGRQGRPQAAGPPGVYAVAGVPNDVMGEGPIPASKLALKKAGLTLSQMDVIESNEAFAAQAIAVARGLELDPAKTNPNGGAIALGHPIGCSGAFIATKALYELQRTGGRYALVTMCIGGGQGIAAVFERLGAGVPQLSEGVSGPGCPDERELAQQGGGLPSTWRGEHEAFLEHERALEAGR
jgi:acetyl-CoA C-acetyltransferase